MTSGRGGRKPPSNMSPGDTTTSTAQAVAAGPRFLITEDATGEALQPGAREYGPRPCVAGPVRAAVTPSPARSSPARSSQVQPSPVQPGGPAAVTCRWPTNSIPPEEPNE